MTVLELWKKIGKQPIKTIRNTEAKILIDGKEYYINSIIYKDGKLIGFECKNVFERRGE